MAEEESQLEDEKKNVSIEMEQLKKVSFNLTDGERMYECSIFDARLSSFCWMQVLYGKFGNSINLEE